MRFIGEADRCRSALLTSNTATPARELQCACAISHMTSNGCGCLACVQRWRGVPVEPEAKSCCHVARGSDDLYRAPAALALDLGAGFAQSRVAHAGDNSSRAAAARCSARRRSCSPQRTKACPSCLGAHCERTRLRSGTNGPRPTSHVPATPTTALAQVSRRPAIGTTPVRTLPPVNWRSIFAATAMRPAASACAG